jgi:glucose/arabinose dehydrogenase
MDLSTDVVSRRGRPRRRGRTGLGAVSGAGLGTVLAVVLAGCTGSSSPVEPASASLAATSTTTTSPSPSATRAAPSASPTSSAAIRAGGRVTAHATVLARNLPVPWGIAALPGGNLLISLREEKGLVVVDPTDGHSTRVTGTGADELVSGTVAQGEGGLLGVALSPQFTTDHRVFVYRTGPSANQVLRGELRGDSLGRLTTIVDGIPKGTIHNGGRLAFGPDDDLYVTTGDATGGSESQSLDSLGGKILRVTQDGRPAPGNPFPGSRVWTYGHRNVQGIGWDATGRMFASEFGQDTWDELNVIVPGSNYGWPIVEGKRSDGAGTDPSDPPAHYRDPVATWRTGDASPSGIAVTDDAVYLAALRGQSLWRVPFAQAPDGSLTAFGTPQRLLQNDDGRLRAVLEAPATAAAGAAPESLYVLTNNTDGRGNPSPTDDKLLRVTLTPTP